MNWIQLLAGVLGTVYHIVALMEMSIFQTHNALQGSSLQELYSKRCRYRSDAEDIIARMELSHSRVPS